MDFLKDLHEARMTRNATNQKVLTYTDCCERLYLSLMTLELLRKFPKYAPKVQAYAQKTSGYESYKYFRMNGTDLYNFIYFVIGDEEAINKLKDPGAAQRMRAKTTLPVMAVNRYISQLKSGMATKPAELFIKVESSLNIVNSDYKEVRRGLTNFGSLSTKDKKIVVSRLLLASRAKLRSSDLIGELESLAAEQDYETALVKDTEPTVSLPDIPFSDNAVNYRFLVGDKNMYLAKKTVEYAAKGQSIPFNIAKGYMPIIELVNDIVEAGPAHINMLRVLHKRAKNSLKR